jgi:hypothetical protein
MGARKLYVLNLMLCLTLLLWCSESPSRAQANASVQQSRGDGPPDLVAQVPLEIRESRVSLDVMVNGQGPFPFGLDTGASGDVWVTRALVTRLHLPLVEGFRVGDGSGVNSRGVEGAQIDSLRVGNVSFSQGRKSPPDHAGLLDGAGSSSTR